MRSTVSATDDASSESPAAEPRAKGTPSDGGGSEETIALEAGMTLGRYQLREPIGEGGMGKVWSAHDPALGRMVAIKLLRSASSPEGDLRLRREAQVMAKLVHPNVIRVYDVGVASVGEFVAMELVVGGTLKDWLAREKRSVVDIIDVFAAAGRGLSAAHKAGLVHRDFKPSNVLVSDDGRVLVTDFGLARIASESGGAGSEPGSVPHESPDAITREGALVGTPAYMAPEQLERGTVDARADQFSFCIAVWEALYGAPPFPRDSTQTFLAAVKAGRITEPTTAQVPAPVRAALERGLAAKPSARFPSMPELLDAIDVVSRRRRRRNVTIAGAGGGAVIAAAIAIGAMATEQGDVCAVRSDRFAGVWDANVRTRLERAVDSLKKPFAHRAFTVIAEHLDQTRAAWEAMRRDSCEATRVRKEQSDTALDLRTACLDRKFEEVKSFVATLATPDGALLEKALENVTTVGDVSLCADVVGLGRRAPLPADPKRRLAIVELDTEIAKQRAVSESGRVLPPKISDDLVSRAKQLGYAPTTAAALYVAASDRFVASDFERARSLYEEAMLQAESAGDDLLRHQIEVQLASVTGAWLEDFAEGRRHVERALAVLDRLGDQPLRRAQVIGQESSIVWRHGDFQHARQLAEEALAITQRVAPTGIDHANALYRLAVVLNDLDEPQESLKLCNQAIDIVTKLYGPDHPKIANFLNTRGGDYRRMGKHALAKADYERALAIYRASTGDDSIEAAYIFSNLATLADKEGDHESAIANHKKTIAIYERKFGPVHSRTLIANERLATVLSHAGRKDEAKALFEHVLDVERTHLGENHTFTANTHFYYAKHLDENGEPEQALPHLDAALRILSTSQGTNSKLLVRIYDGIAQVYEHQKRYADAARTYEQALARIGEDPTGGELQAVIEHDLAVALFNSGDRARAKSVAASAREKYVKLGDDASEDLKEFDAWIAKNHLK